MTQAQIAEQLARKCHAGQFRRDGVTPYITHPEAVAAVMETDTEKAVAWLHDVLEDTECTAQHLQDSGVAPEVIVAVCALTNYPGLFEDYSEYLEIVMTNDIAIKVKIADIRHNLSCNPTEKQKEKYKYALSVLEAT